MPRRRLYSEPFFKAVTNATVDYVEGRIVEPGLVLFVTTASLEDEDHAPTTIAFGKKVGERFEGFEEENAPSTGIRFHTENTHHFVAGEWPCWRVEGTVLGDKLRGYAEGYYEEI